ncbi:hypothetical protein OAB94_01865 [Flavobacteriaceae bacterium]|nr:hypothetical protein [Flavobacteriaceae bacterium]
MRNNSRGEDLIIPRDFWNGLWNPITGKLPSRRPIFNTKYRDRSKKMHEF